MNFSVGKMEANGLFAYLIVDWDIILRHQSNFDTAIDSFENLEGDCILARRRKSLVSFDDMPFLVPCYFYDFIGFNCIKTEEGICFFILTYRHLNCLIILEFSSFNFFDFDERRGD